MGIALRGTPESYFAAQQPTPPPPPPPDQQPPPQTNYYIVVDYTPIIIFGLTLLGITFFGVIIYLASRRG